MEQVNMKRKSFFLRVALMFVLIYSYLLLALSMSKVQIQVTISPYEEGKYTARLYYSEIPELSKQDVIEVPIESGTITFELPISDFSRVPYYCFEVPQGNGLLSVQSLRVAYGSRVLTQWNAEKFCEKVEQVSTSDSVQFWFEEDSGLHFYRNLALVTLRYLLVGTVVVLLLYKLVKVLYCLPVWDGYKERVKHFMVTGLDTIRGNHSVMRMLFFVYSGALLLVLFLNFLQGKAYWLFVGVASDSYGQSYPTYYNLARRVSQGLNVAGWDFYRGLGDAIGQVGVSLNNWIVFWGEENVAVLMVFSYIIKIVLAQTAFYQYLRVLGRTRITSYVFSLGYAFCGHMILRGRWVYYPNEVLIVAVLLLCFELFFVKKDVRWLPLAIILFARESGTYPTILYSVVFAGYAIFRYFVQRNFIWKEFRKYCVQLLACILLVMPIVMWNFTGLSGITSSARFTNGVEAFTSSEAEEKGPIFLEKEYIQSAYFRTIGLDILGVETEEYTGADNVLEDPTFYCGLLTLLCIPFAIKGREKKIKYWYLAVSGVVAAYFFINPLRTIINGMVEPYHFKLSSFWIIVLMLYLGSEGLDRLAEGYRSARASVITLVVIIALGWILIKWANPDVNVTAFGVSCVFMAIYTVLLLFLQKETLGEYQRLTIKGVTVAVCVVEIFVMTYDYINPSQGIITNVDARTRLNDYTLEALDFLDEYEDNDYYRIDKQYISYGYNDSMYQGYQGTKSYIGGTGVRGEVWDLYESLGMPKSTHSKIFGTSSSDPLNTLSAVKYIFSKNPIISNYGYEQIGSAKGIYIYENQYALPFVYGYNKYIGRDDFEELSFSEKQNAMLEYCVLEDGSHAVGLSGYGGSAESDMNLLKKYQVDWNVTKGGRIRINKNKEGEAVLLFVKANNKTGDTVRGNIYFTTQNKVEGSLEVAIPEGNNYLRFAFNEENLRYFKMEFAEQEDFKAEIFSIYVVPQEEYYQHYRDSIEQLQDISLENFAIDYKTSTLSGEVTLDTPTELCFSIPYDKNWKLTVDGEQVKTQKANIAFIGAYLQEGTHEFELQYIVPNQGTQAMVIKIGYILVFAFFLGNSAWRVAMRRKKLSIANQIEK